ncbi:S-adenosylmethionine synthase isoform type-2 [Liparis tanakae]|uniref:S-adenosylmethionine synthase isoform type-2 n=1 Tax=Liparis tanakae TaxID=230148 RepID=A0A4Z2HY28_9TELE|nr:S-adenosylmethionine synthase isoform type-2 [Liparis tanakae]
MEEREEREEREESPSCWPSDSRSPENETDESGEKSATIKEQRVGECEKEILYQLITELGFDILSVFPLSHKHEKSESSTGKRTDMERWRMTHGRNHPLMKLMSPGDLPALSLNTAIAFFPRPRELPQLPLFPLPPAISYAIGGRQPLSISVFHHGSLNSDEDELLQIVQKNFH